LAGVNGGQVHYESYHVPGSSTPSY
jgi:hypothetical protein